MINYLTWKLITVLIATVTHCHANFCFQAVSGTADLPAQAQMVSCANAAGCIRGKVTPVVGGGSTYFWDCMGYSDFGSYSPSWSWWATWSDISAWTASSQTTVAPVVTATAIVVNSSWSINWFSTSTTPMTSSWSDGAWSFWGGTAWTSSILNTNQWTSYSESWTTAWAAWTSWLAANNITVPGSNSSSTWLQWNLGSPASWITWNAWGYRGTARYTCTDGSFDGFWNSGGAVLRGVSVSYCICCADGCNRALSCKTFSSAESIYPYKLLIFILMCLLKLIIC